VPVPRSRSAFPVVRLVHRRTILAPHSASAPATKGSMARPVKDSYTG
jgi:hypothetical protein